MIVTIAKLISRSA